MTLGGQERHDLTLGVSACECKALTPFANVNDMANTEVDNVNEVMNQNVHEKKEINILRRVVTY